MLEYRGLPVLEGDAHLLVSGRGAYLVDGGGHGRGLATLLRSRKIRRLRAAVITHFDVEHAEGVIALLAGRFPMTECWVPSSLVEACRVALSLPCDALAWRRAVGGSGVAGTASVRHEPSDGEPAGVRRVLVEGGRALARLAADCCMGHVAALGDEDRERHRARLHDPALSRDELIRMLSQGGLVDLDELGTLGASCGTDDAHLLCAVLAGAVCGRAAVSDPDASLGATLSLLSRAAILLGEFPGRIRFFSCEDYRTDHLVPHHHMVCLNGIETAPSVSRVPADTAPEALAAVVRGASDDRFCNVYRFGTAAGAVLFCSDSVFPFIGPGGKLALDRPTLIAVPRHGSPACDRVYPLLETERPEDHVWVASYSPSTRKCSDWFMGMPRAFCVNCRGELLKEVVARLDEDGWLVFSGNVCG